MVGMASARALCHRMRFPRETLYAASAGTAAIPGAGVGIATAVRRPSVTARGFATQTCALLKWGLAVPARIRGKASTHRASATDRNKCMLKCVDSQALLLQSKRR